MSPAKFEWSVFVFIFNFFFSSVCISQATKLDLTKLDFYTKTTCRHVGADCTDCVFMSGVMGENGHSNEKKKWSTVQI